MLNINNFNQSVKLFAQRSFAWSAQIQTLNGISEQFRKRLLENIKSEYLEAFSDEEKAYIVNGEINLKSIVEKLNDNDRQLYYFIDFCLVLSRSIISFKSEFKKNIASGMPSNELEIVANQFDSAFIADYHNLLTRFLVNGIYFQYDMEKLKKQQN